MNRSLGKWRFILLFAFLSACSKGKKLSPIRAPEQVENQTPSQEANLVANQFHKIGMLMTGGSLTLQNQAGATKKEKITAAIDMLFDPNSKQHVAFTNWLVSVLADRWKIQVVRNEGFCDECAWEAASTPAVKEFNSKYLKRKPDRIYFDPNQTIIFGGDAFDIPPSDFDHPGEAPYALFELEPLIAGAFNILQEQDFGEVVSGNITLRSEALRDAETQFPTQRNKLLPLPLNIVHHWSGEWNPYLRVDPNGATQRGGVLNTLGFLRGYLRPREWANSGIYQAMLCTEIEQSPPPPVLTPLYVQGDPNPLGSASDCKGCHNMLDGLANLRFSSGTFVRFKSNGLQMGYPAPTNRIFDLKSDNGLQQMNQAFSTSLPKWPMTSFLKRADSTYVPVQTFEQLGEALASDPRFHRCQVGAFVDALFGHLSADERETELQNALNAYYQAGRKMKAALVAMVLSPNFGH